MSYGYPKRDVDILLTSIRMHIHEKYSYFHPECKDPNCAGCNAWRAYMVLEQTLTEKGK